MAWKEPKTNWIAADYFNVEDWNRIIGNIEYIGGLGENIVGPIQLEKMSEKTYSDMLYADEINSIENNIQNVNKENLFGQMEKKVWASNRAAPSYMDFNRWEGYISFIKTKMDKILDSYDFCDDGVYCVEDGIGGWL